MLHEPPTKGWRDDCETAEDHLFYSVALGWPSKKKNPPTATPAPCVFGEPRRARETPAYVNNALQSEKGAGNHAIVQESHQRHVAA